MVSKLFYDEADLIATAISHEEKYYPSG